MFSQQQAKHLYTFALRHIWKYFYFLYFLRCLKGLNWWAMHDKNTHAFTWSVSTFETTNSVCCLQEILRKLLTFLHLGMRMVIIVPNFNLHLCSFTPLLRMSYLEILEKVQCRLLESLYWVLRKLPWGSSPWATAAIHHAAGMAIHVHNAPVNILLKMGKVHWFLYTWTQIHFSHFQGEGRSRMGSCMDLCYT